MKDIPDDSVDMIVTSPPYPMIEMWDEQFIAAEPSMESLIAEAENTGDPAPARRLFEAMHRVLDGVWAECRRVLKPGGFACINIGDAVRTIGGRFRMYPNHSRIITAFDDLGFDCLPMVRWQKSTNAPNKFMGSGMLPAGAYVTLEYETILIFRNGEKQVFKTQEEKLRRRESAIFWEERNQWYSDIWMVKGERQKLGSGKPGETEPSSLRQRSGAYPWELPYRLILMYSLYGDTVLDPFTGTGGTAAAALAAGRNSLGYEIEPGLGETIIDRLTAEMPDIKNRAEKRKSDHGTFVSNHLDAGKTMKYRNEHIGLPVKTMQEKDLRLFGCGKIEIPGSGGAGPADTAPGPLTITARHREL